MPPPLFPRPRVHTVQPDCRCHAVFTRPHHCSAPSVSFAAPPSSTPFLPRLTSPVLSSGCRTRQCPPRPSELLRHLGTLPCGAVNYTPPPPPVSGENLAAPPCPTQLTSVPRGLPTGRATRRPPAKRRRLRHRVRGQRTVIALSPHVQHWLAWAGCAARPGQ
jgi:hypothetical protein